MRNRWVRKQDLEAVRAAAMRDLHARLIEELPGVVAERLDTEPESTFGEIWEQEVAELFSTWRERWTELATAFEFEGTA